MSTEHEKSPADEIRLSHICLEEAEAILKVSPRIAAREAYLAMLHAAGSSTMPELHGCSSRVYASGPCQDTDLAIRSALVC